MTPGEATGGTIKLLLAVRCNRREGRRGRVALSVWCKVRAMKRREQKTGVVKVVISSVVERRESYALKWSGR